MGKFGTMIRDERLIQNLDQKELGKRAGVTGAYITQIEKGQKIPSLSIIVRLARALSLDERHLLRVALMEKSPEVAEKFFGGEEMPAGGIVRKERAGKALTAAEKEMLDMMEKNEDIKMEMRRHFNALLSKLRRGGGEEKQANKALRDFLNDPQMPRPEAHELELLMSVNLSHKEPTKWFYKSLLDSYRNEAFFSRRRRKARRLAANDINHGST